MRKIFATILFTVIGLGIAFGQTKVTTSSVGFKIKNMGIGVTGTLGGLQLESKFNPADLASSSINASVETNTINSDNSSRDEHLHKEEFFDVAHYPKITLKSISFTHKSGNNYVGQFNLTIKDKTKQVEIPFTYTDKGSSASFNGAFKINRLDYGVGGNSLILSNDVNITIVAEISK